MTIKIAVVGPTNVGKTTFISTLMRAVVGKISDEANVTKEGTRYDYDGLQATFIDTPGFQQPGLALQYIEGIKLTEKYMEKIKYDVKAIETIKTSDIAIYLGSLSVVPDDSPSTEIEVIKMSQSKVIAVLNQYHINYIKLGEKIVDGRIQQWTEVFHKNGINDIIIFDAHWDKRSKEQEIYDAIEKNLDASKKADFRQGLNKFKTREGEIKKIVTDTLIKTIKNLQQINIKVKKSEYKEEECQKQIAEQILNEKSNFIEYVSNLYQKAAQYPTKSATELEIEIEEKISIFSRIGNVAIISGFITPFGAAIGGIVGAVGAAVVSGGLGTVAGGTLGAQIGGGIGGALGSLAIFLDGENFMNTTLKSSAIENIVKDLLLLVWEYEHKGFALKQNLSQEEIINLIKYINQLFTENKIDDWTKIDEINISKYCQDIIKQLDKIEPLELSQIKTDDRTS